MFDRKIALILSLLFVLCLAGYGSCAKDAPQLSDNQMGELNRMAIAKANSGDLEQAVAVFDRTLKISNNNVVALFNRGKVHLIQGRLDRAIHDLDRTIKLDPSLAEAYVARGMAHRVQGDLSRAQKDLDKALSLDAGNTIALLNRAADIF